MRRTLMVVGIIASAVPFCHVHAATVLALTVEELAESSDRVIRARVVSQEIEVEARFGFVFTRTTLRVIEDLVGDGPSVVVVRQLGGSSEEHGLRIEGDAGFELGEEVVVFVSRGRSGVSLFHLVGLALGKFRVERSGREVNATRRLEGLHLIRGDRVELPVEKELSLDELRHRVRSDVRENLDSSQGEER